MTQTHSLALRGSRFPSHLRRSSTGIEPDLNFRNGPPSIAILAPVQESLNPKGYAGTERVIRGLAKGLFDLGIRADVFASGDSEEIREYANLHAITPVSLRSVQRFREDVALRELMTLPISMRAFRMMAQMPSLKIISNHMGFQALPAAQMSPLPIVTTIHGDIKYPAEREMYEQAEDHRFISISDSQRRAMPELNYMSTVHNPIEAELFNPRFGREIGSVWPGHIDMQAGSYLAWIGRFSAVKRPHVAIETAMLAGMRIVLAGKREVHESDYWDAKIQPLLEKYGDRVVLLGELDDQEKGLLYRGARALLFPIDWEEPFGLVGPEAMACGTPVIATRMGAVPEWLVDGKTGYIVDPIEDEVKLAEVMAARVAVVGNLSRHACREHVVANFGTTAVAKKYLASFNQVIASHWGHRLVAHA